MFTEKEISCLPGSIAFINEFLESESLFKYDAYDYISEQEYFGKIEFIPEEKQ